MSATLAREMEKHAQVITTALTTEANQVASLRTYNEQARDRDPSKLAWPATLPIELALKTASPQELRVHYGFTDEEWDGLRTNPIFMTELVAACDLVKQEGMSFKLKARLQSEALLETSWRLMHAPHSEVPPAVKTRLMEATWRMAGFDNKDTAGAGGSNMLNIQINLGG